MAKDKGSKNKHEVDFDEYEEKEGGYDGEQPLKGTFDGKLISLKEHESASGDGYEWIFEITEEPYAGWRGWVYSNMDASKWKTQQITKAINGGAEVKTTLDPIDSDGDGSKSKTVKKASPVRLRMKKEKYDGEDKARIARVMPNEDAPKSKKKKEKKGDDPF